MACEDLRHVCGACGFKWPERSAYDELTFTNMRLRDEIARLKAALLVAEVELEKVAQGVVDRGRAESAAALMRRAKESR